MAARTGGLRRQLLQPWILIPVAALIAGGIWYGFFRSTSSASSGTTVRATATQQSVPVTRGTLQQTVTASGTIEAATTEDLSFSSPGTVTAVDVIAGQTVKAGQALASLNSAQLQSGVAQAQQTVDQATAKVDADETSGASSTQLTADEANLASAQAQLTLAQQNLAGATLTSPIAGTVAQVNLSVGQQLGSSGTSGLGLSGTGTGSGRSSASGGSTASPASTTVQVEVISTGSYTVTLNLDTTDIAQVKTGQTALVTPTTSSSTAGGRGGRGFGGGGFGGGGFGGGGFGGGGTGSSGAAGTVNAGSSSATSGQQVSGTVTSVGLIAQASSGVATFPVQVTVNGSAADFHPGAIANVDIVYSQVQNALEVPSLAVNRTGANPTVTALVNGKKETRTVQLGITSGAEVQVVSGLSEGDTVALSLPGAARGTANRFRQGGQSGRTLPGDAG